MDEHAGYYAIIPAPVMYAESLSANEKLLYGTISGLCRQEGYCWASNQYLADLYKVGRNVISKWLAHLRAEGFIEIEIDREAGNRRRIYIAAAYYSQEKQVLLDEVTPITPTSITPITPASNHIRSSTDKSNLTSKRKEQKKSYATPESVTLDDSLLRWCSKSVPDIDPAKYLPYFVNLCKAKHYKYRSYRRAFQNFITREQHEKGKHSKHANAPRSIIRRNNGRPAYSDRTGRGSVIE